MGTSTVTYTGSNGTVRRQRAEMISRARELVPVLAARARSASSHDSSLTRLSRTLFAPA